MADWIIPKRLFDGQHLREGVALRIEQGRVAAIEPAPIDGRQVEGIVSPGFVDLQVNGGGGVLLNTTPTAQGMAAIAAAHRQFGTVAILPTVITDTPEVLAAAVQAALNAQLQSGILGLHIEGPHIALARRGTHAAAFVRPLDDATLGHVQRLRAADIPVVITLAPEAATPTQIAVLVAMGAIVSIGHSDANAQDVDQALEAGASCFTHLYNAMSAMQGRAPGVAGAAINSTAYAGIIVDGHHVADDMVALAIRARPVPDRMFLVSDAMPTVGGPDHFDLYGSPLHLSGGRLVNADGNLAGAHVTQADGVARLVNSVGLTPEDALRMAITVPANLMALPQLASIVGRPLSDLIHLDDQMQFTGWLAW